MQYKKKQTKKEKPKPTKKQHKTPHQPAELLLISKKGH